MPTTSARAPSSHLPLSALRAQQCLSIAYWLPRLIEVLKSIELRTPTKMSGSQKYLLTGSENVVYVACVRAKGIASNLFYVPLLDAVQQSEKSGKAAEQAPEICQHAYDWLMHAATEEGVMGVLKCETQLFECNDRCERLDEVIYDCCWTERHGAQGYVRIVDQRVKRYLQLAFQDCAIVFHRHTARYQSAPCPLAPDDSNWAKHGGELTNLTGAMAEAMNNAMLTGCHVESAHGTRAALRRAALACRGARLAADNVLFLFCVPASPRASSCAGLVQNVYSRGKRQDPWSRCAVVKASYNKSMSWLLQKSLAEQAIRWKLGKDQAAAERAEQGTVTGRKRKDAEASRPQFEAETERALTKQETVAAFSLRIREMTPITRWSEMLPLSAPDVGDQVHWFRLKVDVAKGWLGRGNGISVPTGSKLNKMMFLSDLLITHVGPQAKDCAVADIEKAAGGKVCAPSQQRRARSAASSPPTRALAARVLVRCAGSEVDFRRAHMARDSRDAHPERAAAVQGELGGWVSAELGLLLPDHAHGGGDRGHGSVQLHRRVGRGHPRERQARQRASRGRAAGRRPRHRPAQVRPFRRKGDEPRRRRSARPRGRQQEAGRH
jgi:hypothetical protein